MLIPIGFFGSGASYYISNIVRTGLSFSNSRCFIDSSGISYFGGWTQSGSTYYGTNFGKLSELGELTWGRNLDDGSTSTTEETVFVGTDSSGNVYTSANATVGGSNTAISAKYNSSGTLQFQNYLTDSFGYTIAPRDSIVDSSGNLYTASLHLNSPNYTQLITKVTSSGSVGYLKDFSLSGVDLDTRAIGVDTSGNAYVASNTFANSALIHKVNSSGVSQWAKTVTTGNGFYPYAVTSDTSGNVYISGYESSSGGASLVVKLNTSGTFQWAKKFASNQYKAMATDSSGNLYMVGDTTSGTPSVVYIKLDSSGNVVWERKYATGSTMYSGNIAISTADPFDLTISCGYSTGSGSDGIDVLKLANDGTNTGTWGSRTISTISTTVSSVTPTVTSQTMTDVTSGIGLGTSFLTSSTITPTVTATTI